MNIDSLIALDRNWLLAWNGSNSAWLDSFMLMLTHGLLWLPLYLGLIYLVLKNNEKFSQIMLIVFSVFLCLLLTEGVSDFVVKPLVERSRPFADPLIGSLVDVARGYRPGGYSFFSGHAANTMGVALFFCLLVRQRLFTAVMVLWSAINCYTRIYLGVHFPGDVLVGILWGALSAVVAYLFYHKVYTAISPKLHYISTQYTLTGYSLTDIYIIINIFLATIICVAIYASVVAIPL